MADRPVETNLHEDFITLCNHQGYDARFTLSNQIEGAFVGRHKDFDNIQGTVSLCHIGFLFFITSFKIIPLILQCLKPHFTTGEMILINKYLYSVYFAEPSPDAPTDGSKNSRSRQILRMYFTALKFIGDYLTLGRHYSRASAIEVQKLVDTAFPELADFVASYGLDGTNPPRARGASMDLLKFDRNLEVLGSTDWPALYRVAELEERRRGRAIK